ncbi:hypothetical protein B4Q13_18895 [Lacticaseibacillus rhamnosus]
MSFLAECKSLLASAIGRKRMEQEMDAELKFHIASYAEDLVRSGMPRKEAERMAGVELGVASVHFAGNKARLEDRLRHRRNNVGDEGLCDIRQTLPCTYS